MQSPFVLEPGMAPAFSPVVFFTPAVGMQSVAAMLQPSLFAQQFVQFPAFNPATLLSPSFGPLTQSVATTPAAPVAAIQRPVPLVPHATHGKRKFETIPPEKAKRLNAGTVSAKAISTNTPPGAEILPLGSESSLSALATLAVAELSSTAQLSKRESARSDESLAEATAAETVKTELPRLTSEPGSPMSTSASTGSPSPRSPSSESEDSERTPPPVLATEVAPTIVKALPVPASVAAAAPDILALAAPTFQPTLQNAYETASWAEMFARVRQIMKRDKLRQKAMAAEMRFSGSTLSPLLKGKYQHTKEEHVRRLRTWAHACDQRMWRKVSNRCTRLGLSEADLARVLNVDPQILHAWLTFTLPLALRAPVDNLLLRWLQSSV